MSREPGSPIKLAILIPTHEKVDALWAYDLAQMVSLSMSEMPADMGHDMGILMMTNTYIHKARTQLLQEAIATGATHVLWLDSDMRFPPDTFLRLLQRDVPVVGINYSKRRFPPEFVAIKRVPREGDDPQDGEVLHTTNESEGLEEVDVIGFGAVLMETATLVNLPDPKYDPWFWFGKTDHGADIGEDAWFCLKMLQDVCGQRIFVDHDLSKQCAHIGQFEFKTYHAADLAETLQELRTEEELQEA
jgi:hypothetical protein